MTDLPRTPPELRPGAKPAASPPNVWIYCVDGAEYRVETPVNLSLHDWDMLRKYLDVVKPCNAPGD